MVTSNFKVVKFPDNTSLIKMSDSRSLGVNNKYIFWTYEDDEELVEVMFMAKHLKSLGVKPILVMPYIPNARMDRVHSKENEVFTLKYFCEFINSLEFEQVLVFDAHSDVSMALLDRVTAMDLKGVLAKAVDKSNPDVIYFPDAGAMKRYGGVIKEICGDRKLNVAYGNKVRDWDTGEIKGLEVMGNIPNGAKVLMIDDICSYGGTMYYSAKKLKELGAGDIEMYVSHCENSIADPEKGKVFKEEGLIDKVYTTDSILTIEHPKIELVATFVSRI